MKKSIYIVLALVSFLLLGKIQHVEAAEKEPIKPEIAAEAGLKCSAFDSVLCSENDKSCVSKISKYLKPEDTSIKYAKFSPQPQIVYAKREITPRQSGESRNADVLFDLINAHRASIGKNPFSKEENLCQIANSRSPELPIEAANGNFHAGLHAKNLPFWITEDMKYGGTEQEIVNWWLNSPIHRAAIEGDYMYSCGHCNGDVCIMLFTSYAPKNLL